MANKYAEHFNIVITPCISPWGYETINRWNPDAVDPNRSFTPNSEAEESAALLRYISALKTNIEVHIDLHETTDTDNTEFIENTDSTETAENAGKHRQHRKRRKPLKTLKTPKH